MSYVTLHLDETKLTKRIIFAVIATIILLLNYLIPEGHHIDRALHISPENYSAIPSYSAR